MFASNMLEINIHEDTTGDDYCSLIELAYNRYEFLHDKSDSLFG